MSLASRYQDAMDYLLACFRRAAHSVKTMADANWVIAFCTAVLVGVTWYYASLSNRLTNRLVELQVEPSVEIGVAEPFQAATVVTLRNIGAQDVTDSLGQLEVLFLSRLR